MKYREVTIETSQAGLEVVSAVLEDLGIRDLQLVDPRELSDKLSNLQLTEYVEPGDFADEMRRTPAVQVYASDDLEGMLKVERIKTAMLELDVAVRDGEFGDGISLGSLEVSERLVDDEDWKDRWKEYYEPQQLTEHIWVTPSWIDFAVDDPYDIVISIDPGMAFGTGTHETTQLTLQMMEKYMHDESKVLDVGCGSGILSIAAVKLGAADVLGIDLDPEAVRVSRENFWNNRATPVAKAVEGNLTAGVNYIADMIVANLLTDLILELADDISKHLIHEGLFISSGILLADEGKVVDKLKSLNFRILQVAEQNEWCCIVAKKDRIDHAVL